MKKITRRSFITVCGAAAAAMALTACGGAASSTVASSAAESTSSSAAAETAAGTLSGNVATGGSTSMKNVIAALTEGFAEVEPGVTVSYDPTGSGAGITGATDKTLDIGLSSCLRRCCCSDGSDRLRRCSLFHCGILCCGVHLFFCRC